MEINLRVLLDWKLYGHKKSVFFAIIPNSRYHMEKIVFAVFSFLEE